MHPHSLISACFLSPESMKAFKDHTGRIWAHSDLGCLARPRIKYYVYYLGLKIICNVKSYTILLFCQPRVEVTSCFVYKVMGLTFHNRINTQQIYRIAVAQVVTRRITKPQRTFLGSNLTGCYFLFIFFFHFFWGGGRGGLEV